MKFFQMTVPALLVAMEAMASYSEQSEEAISSDDAKSIQLILKKEPQLADAAYSPGFWKRQQVRPIHMAASMDKPQGHDHPGERKRARGHRETAHRTRGKVNAR